ncbi:RagB/SusD family nutrient uptake outer membrane protein [Geofilum sp. OHC36d9]|uniref:RagB/SusD family nutrient uptake outer membrane protein n=1 Tax=Geofilum sp. OHC36d9 TaxID=3458413 RepID=UPI0040346020
MKKLIYSFIFILVIASSCENVLDKEPLDIISDAAVWNDEVLIDSYLTGVYTRMCVWDKDSWTEANARTWWHMDIDGISDEASDRGLGSWKRGSIKVNSNPLPWWEDSYKIIRDLNTFIDRVPDSPVSEDFKIDRAAEARFIRAYNYFAMVIRYGGVPLITSAQSIDDSEEELFRSRDSEKTIYDFIISECDDIFNDLPSVRTTDYGRPTKWAAAALKCRAALYAGSIAQFGTQQLDGILGFPASEAKDYYKISYDAASTIISGGVHSLFNRYPEDKIKNFKQLFLEDENEEVIFARVHDEYVSNWAPGQGWSLDFFQGPKPNAWGSGNTGQPYLEMVDEFENVNGTPGEAAPLDRDAIQQGFWTGEELFQGKEPRFFATIYYQGMAWKGINLSWHKGIILPDGSVQETGSYQGLKTLGEQAQDYTQGSGFGILKYLDEDKDVNGERNTSPQDWKLFRYGEVLLNFAEAAFELDKPDEALNAINKIRVRAGVAQLTDIDRDKIRHERKIELAFEGHRYWDVRRWRTAVNELTSSSERKFSGLRYRLDYNTRKYQVIVVENLDGTVNPPAFYDRNYYFPITPARTGNNSNLLENPGYDN